MYIVSLIKLYHVIEKEKPLIVHSITSKAGLHSMIAGKSVDALIKRHTFRGLIFPSKKGSLQKLFITIDKLLCCSATTIIPDGNGVKMTQSPIV
jgi:hypothetical protein